MPQTTVFAAGVYNPAGSPYESAEVDISADPVGTIYTLTVDRTAGWPPNSDAKALEVKVEWVDAANNRRPWTAFTDTGGTKGSPNIFKFGKDGDVQKAFIFTFSVKSGVNTEFVLSW